MATTLPRRREEVIDLEDVVEVDLVEHERNDASSSS
jgi:hypothetical protein